MTANNLSPLPPVLIHEAVKNALKEDLGRSGDLTSQNIVPEQAIAKGVICARETGILAGVDLAVAAFKACSPEIEIDVRKKDGDKLNASPTGDVVMHIEGPARAVLSAERVALNYLGHLSGIAAQTGLYVAAIQGTKARITCTRKTTPGLRALEKYAVRAGGGFNHRFGLDDGILIKDNHIVVAGSVTAALQAALSGAGHMVRVEIEIDTLDQLKEALNAGAQAVLLDNMAPDVLVEAMKIIDSRATAEASGNVTLDTVRAIAETGVDYISVGRITHSAPCIDLGLDFEIS